jgi:hypothetical protein
MAEDNFKRIGLALPAHVRDRLSEIALTHGVTQSFLMEAIVSTMSYTELEEIFKRARALRELEEELHRKASKDVLGLVRGRTAEHIAQMTIAVRQQGATAPGKDE